jgi:ABC-type multidrug transport system permease subunit
MLNFENWQDVALAIINFLLWIALVPTLLNHADKPDYRTSLMTGLLLSGVAFIISTLGLWLAASIISLSAITWFVLLYQKWRSKRLQKQA